MLKASKANFAENEGAVTLRVWKGTCLFTAGRMQKVKGKGVGLMKKILCFLLSAALIFSLSSCAQGGALSAPADKEPASSVLAVSGEEASVPEEEIIPEPEPEADNSWQVDQPENHHMDPEVFEALHAALPGSGIHAVVTVKDGVIIDEYYEEGYDENSLFQIHSASKSFTSALIGIAIDEGYIGGVDDLVADYLPQLLEQEDERKHQLTLRHLLTHTSGLEWYEWGSGYSNWNEFRSAENWVDYILNRNLVSAPGTVFNYSTGNTHLLSAVLQAATGMTQEEYCRKHLFDPMGISPQAYWQTDPQGIADGGNGVIISARDAAKFGQLFLDGGVWKDKQLVPSDWVEQSTSIQNPGPGDSTGAYGYQWWIRTHTTGEYGSYTTPYPTASYDTYFAFGYGGQMIYVVPELELVAVFASGCQSSYAPRPYFTDYILNAYMA